MSQSYLAPFGDSGTKLRLIWLFQSGVEWVLFYYVIGQHSISVGVAWGPLAIGLTAIAVA